MFYTNWRQAIVGKVNMKLRGIRIDKKTGTLSLKDKYSPPEATLGTHADYVPSVSKDMREEWKEPPWKGESGMVFKNNKYEDKEVNRENFKQILGGNDLGSGLIQIEFK